MEGWGRGECEAGEGGDNDVIGEGRGRVFGTEEGEDREEFKKRPWPAMEED